MTIPDKDTTYWCEGFMLPEEIRNKTRHIIKVCILSCTFILCHRIVNLSYLTPENMPNIILCMYIVEQIMIKHYNYVGHVFRWLTWDERNESPITVWTEVLVENLFWWIGGFESKPPIFPSAKSFIVWCHYYVHILCYIINMWSTIVQNACTKASNLERMEQK